MPERGYNVITWPRVVEVGVFDLSGKVMVVAGGSGYLGTAVCKGLIEQGASVIVFDTKSPSNFTPECYRNVDVADEAAVARALVEVVSEHMALHCAVNMTFSNAGVPFDDLSLADWNRSLRTNVIGAFLFSREAARHIAASGGGSIVHFSSMYGVVSPDPRMYPTPDGANPVDYGVGKAGILQMTRYQAVRWAERKVRVNAVVPGAFPNPLVQQDAAFVAKLSAKNPMGRIGQPHELAGAVVFLASDASSYMTGQQLVIDGGWTIW